MIHIEIEIEKRREGTTDMIEADKGLLIFLNVGSVL